jgi:ATP-binding cassette, sub-family E, member 1
MRKRLAVIDKNKCHPEECGNYLCAKLCPVNRTGADCIYPGDIDNKARIDEVLCTGCGICPTRCPFGAIQIINLPTHLNKEPVHRYGENMFELYSLPTPLFGKVTGIVGKNGIGKSTALKIMSNIIKPNLGNWKSPPDFKEVIKYFRGSETQKFLTKLQKNEINLSYKPQQVDLIPKQFSGTVRELLSKIDESKVELMAEKLQLKDFLETDIRKISGGELQRVAIAASTIKDANIYMFDEPTSYLDIKQRVKISQFITSFANDDTSVIAIEHDLIILDYMTDLVNVMYGHEGAFGIVSTVKNTREGINAFLDGFLREENVRFRQNPLKFEKGQERAVGLPENLVSWTKMSKKLDHFELSADPGVLLKNEVIGVLGENGIGKTSFIKILAGLIKPDEGEIDGDIKVSYKPQYLESDSDVTVSEFIIDAIGKYERQLIKPLNLETLYGQKLSELSGGQLQRVALARCLSQEADLFLLDEPSAYLDVEQRLLISKMIKTIAEERNITVILIDHDLMFLDYISDRLLVFSGIPAKEGTLKGPFTKKEGMNRFLKELGITLRRDVHSHRPRINKLASVKDREQKSAGNYYY